MTPARTEDEPAERATLAGAPAPGGSGSAAMPAPRDSDTDDGPESSPHARLVRLAVGLVAVLLVAGLIAVVPALRHAVSLAIQGDLTGLRHQFRGLGAGGVMLLLALMLAHAVVWYPTELVTATAGLVYGFLPGLALVTGGWLLSGLLSYVLGRTVGEPLAQLLFGRRRVVALRHAVERGGVPLLLGLRLVPIVPYSLTGYVAGAARVPVWRFAWTSVVGYIPLTALVAYLGSQSRSLSLSDPRLWVAIAVVIALLAAARTLRPVLDRHRAAERG